MQPPLLGTVGVQFLDNSPENAVFHSLVSQLSWVTVSVRNVFLSLIQMQQILLVCRPRRQGRRGHVGTVPSAPGGCRRRHAQEPQQSRGRSASRFSAAKPPAVGDFMPVNKQKAALRTCKGPFSLCVCRMHLLALAQPPAAQHVTNSLKATTASSLFGSVHGFNSQPSSSTCSAASCSAGHHQAYHRSWLCRLAASPDASTV